MHNLLAKHLAEFVGFTPGEARQADGDEQYLVLVYYHTIGFIQPLLKPWVEIGHLLATMLGVNKVRDAIHRAGTVERNHRHDILNSARLELLNVLGHLRTFELEDTSRLTTC